MQKCKAGEAMQVKFSMDFRECPLLLPRPCLDLRAFTVFYGGAWADTIY